MNKAAAAAADMEWPLLHSEATTEEDDDEDAAGSRAGHYQDRYLLDVQPGDPLVGGSAAAAACDIADLERSGCDERVSCAVWQQLECRKVDLTVVDISCAVIRKAEKAKHSNEYMYLALLIALVLAAIPALFRLQSPAARPAAAATIAEPSVLPLPPDALPRERDSVLDSLPVAGSSGSNGAAGLLAELLDLASSQVSLPDPGLLLQSLLACRRCLATRFVVLVAVAQRFCISLCFFFLLCVAERTYREVGHCPFDALSWALV